MLCRFCGSKKAVRQLLLHPPHNDKAVFCSIRCAASAGIALSTKPVRRKKGAVPVDDRDT
jgi:hypothetical protein